ncbi:MAG: hypothetical protein FD123_4013 [Bacteroidetes bacterium]|nr:MAG: hypothetical protein FD123_4013 [Bacteroidota bacterium]
MNEELSRRPGYTALVTFLPGSAGGRRSPVSSGYAAQFEVEGQKRIPAMQTFEDELLVYPGDTVPAQITLLADVNPGIFYEGLSFRFFEGEKLAGTGVITGIL